MKLYPRVQDSILRPVPALGDPSKMSVQKRPRAPEAEPVDEIRRLIAALTDASAERHRLERGTIEYEDALDTEERLAEHVWRLGASLGPAYEGRKPERR
jgi:hypothetical protein